MKFTFPVTKEMVKARSTLPISRIHTHTICKAINKKKYSEAKKIETDLAEEKKPLGKKHKLILEVIEFIVLVLTVYVMVKGYAELVQDQSIYVLLFFTIIMLDFTFKIGSMGQVSLENIVKLIKQKEE